MTKNLVATFMRNEKSDNGPTVRYNLFRQKILTIVSEDEQTFLNTSAVRFIFIYFLFMYMFFVVVLFFSIFYPDCGKLIRNTVCDRVLADRVWADWTGDDRRDKHGDQWSNMPHTRLALDETNAGQRKWSSN